MIKEYDENINQLIRDFGSEDFLSREEEREYIERAQQGDETALLKLFSSNIRLIVKIVIKMKKTGKINMPLEDAVQEGSLGFMHAVFKHDLRNNRLSTYADYWIMQSVLRADKGKNWTIKTPYHLLEFLPKFHKAYNELQQENGRDPSDDEIVKILGTSLGKVRRIKYLLNSRPMSLSTRSSVHNEEGTRPLEEMIADKKYESPLDVLERKEEREEQMRRVDSVLNTLSERDRGVIMLRYGMENGGEIIPYREVGRVFGMSGERVHQIDKKFKSKIRRDQLSYVSSN